MDTPKAVALSRGDGMPYMEAIRRDTAQAEYAVKDAVPKENVLHRLDLSRIRGYAS